MNILITGATGFLGKKILDSLKKKNFSKIIVFSRSINNIQYNNIYYYNIDLLDIASVKNFFNTFNERIDICVHFAWDTTGSFLNDLKNINWFNSSIFLFNEFCKNGGKYFIVAGTCYEYSTEITTDFDEYSSPTYPTTVYGNIKLSLYKYLYSMSLVNNIDLLWLRIFYPIGPGDPSYRLFSGACNAVINNKEYVVGAFRNIYDLVDVRDVANIISILISKNIKGIINISSGSKSNIGETLTSLFNMYGVSHLLKFKDLTYNGINRNNGYTNITANVALLKSILKSYTFIDPIKSLVDCIDDKNNNY